MAQKHKYPFAEEGHRFRILRKAEGIPSAVAFAAKLNWAQSGVAQFELGMRRVPADKALQLRRVIPGFDPLWLWDGDMRGLGYDLRKRIEAEEAKEEEESDTKALSSRRKR